MKDSAQLFGSPSPEAAKFAIDIFNFEKRIAEITPDISYLNDPVKVNNKMKKFWRPVIPMPRYQRKRKSLWFPPNMQLILLSLCPPLTGEDLHSGCGLVQEVPDRSTQFAQSYCSVSSLQQRDFDRTVNHQLLGWEKLKGVLSQYVEFRHFYFCSDDSELMCDSVLWKFN